MSIVEKAIEEEIKRAKSIHGDFKNGHEIYAVLLEEVEEFWELVREKNIPEIDYFEELTQIAAVATRAARQISYKYFGEE